MSKLENTWETYASSWRSTSAEDKRALYEKSLSPECVYTDPLAQTRGWGELLAYMQEFHRQVPGGHFVTVEFMAHHDRSIAKWEMRDGSDAVLGDGVSYGEYDEHGKLVAVNGFYRTPEGNPGRYQHEFRVYGRTGEPCPRCGSPIRRIVVAQRGTHLCPRCQRAT